MLNFDSLKNIINSNSTFLLTTHVNPDADAIGSEMALYFLLKKLKKTVTVINHSQTPDNLLFLDKKRIIQKYNADVDIKIFDSADVLIALDLNQPGRLVSMRDGFQKSNKTKICIDHHQDAEDFTDYKYIDVGSTSTGEIIYDFISSTGIVQLNPEISSSIYSAIMTDTGSFRFERTSSRTHHIAAELINYGADPTEIYYEIYDRGTMSKIKLLGIALNSLTLDKTKKIGYMVITQKDLIATGADESDVDGFVNYCMSIEGVEIGMLFFELQNGMKISFRSRGNIPVNKIAGEFQGGGHSNAAGARLYDASLKDFKEKVILVAQSYLKD